LKICPLCKRTYPDIAKVCPQLHCPNCGSTNIKEKEDDSVAFLSLLGIFLAIPLSIVLGILIGTLGVIMAGVLGIFITVILAGALNLSFYYCNTCGASFYRPVKNVLLKEITRETIDARGSRGDICPNCGAPVEPGARYCWRCGSRLG
jgi:ribosomal protein L40E